MTIDVYVDPDLYPVEAIQATAYVFVDRCYVLLDRSGDAKVKVSLTAKAGTSAEAFAAVAGEFQNELLAQSLRRQLALRYDKIREIIVARAMFGAAPEVADQPPPDDTQLGIDPKFVPATEDDFLEDPLGIAVPWEEKYAANGAALAEKKPGTGATPETKS